MKIKNPNNLLKKFVFTPLLLAKALGPIEGIPGAYNPSTSTTDPGASTLARIFSNVLGVFTLVAGLMFLIYFVIGGLKWVTAGGNPEKVQQARKTMTDAAVGLIVVVAAYGIAFILGTVLGVNILDPGSYIKKFWE